MVADPHDPIALLNRLLWCETTSERVIRPAVRDYRRWTALEDVDRDLERSRECLDLEVVRKRSFPLFDTEMFVRAHLWFATPLASLGDEAAVLLELLRSHHTIVRGTSAVLPGDRGQEGHEVVRVGQHVLCGHLPRVPRIRGLVRLSALCPANTG